MPKARHPLDLWKRLSARSREFVFDEVVMDTTPSLGLNEHPQATEVSAAISSRASTPRTHTLSGLLRTPTWGGFSARLHPGTCKFRSTEVSRTRVHTCVSFSERDILIVEQTFPGETNLS